MLQIISNSNETSTGPELVQNGDFSQVGTDIVNNGGFDDLGTDVITNGSFANTTAGNIITNPNFTDTGGELIKNPNFTGVTEEVGTWTTVGTGWTLDGSNLLGSASTTENLQTIFGTAISRTLSLTFTIENYVSGEVAMLMDGESKSWESANGTYTRIVTTLGTILEIDGRDSNAFTGDITNISVKKLSENWNVLEETCTFGEHGLTMTTTEASDVKIATTTSPLAEEKSYKVIYTIHAVGLTGTNAIQYYTGSSLNTYDDLPEQGVGTHTFYYTTPFETNTNWYFKLNHTGASTTDFVTISSISVEELGEDWTPMASDPDGVSYNENGLTIVQSSDLESQTRVYQGNVTASAKSYKVTYTIFAASYTLGNSAKYYDGDSYVDLPEQGAGTHTFYYTREGANDSWYFNLNTPVDAATDFVTFSNLTVELLGEAWTQGIGWSIGDSKAISTQALGGELITNGNFDATGGELITNGSFDVTGSELVVNGDFLSAVSWNVNANWNINTASGVAEADGTSDLDLNQSIWLPVIGKSYKVTFEVVSRSQGEVLFKLGGVDGQAHTTLGIKTEYIVATSTDRLKIDSQSSFIGSVTDVSVKELGADWTVNNADATHYVEFIETGARFVSDTISPVLTLRQDVVSIGKFYKITCNATYAVGSGAARFSIGGINTSSIQEGNNTIYLSTATTTSTSYILRDAADVDVVLTNVSVEELGEDWTVENTDVTHYVAFIETGARFVSDTISPVLRLRQDVVSIGKFYKITCDATYAVGSGAARFKIGNINTSSIQEGSNVLYLSAATTTLTSYIERAAADVDVVLTNISIEEIATSYLTQSGVLTADKTWKVIYAAVVSAGTVSATEWGAVTSATATVTDFVQVGTTTDFRMVNIGGYFEGSVTGISAELVDPLGLWTLGAGWSIGDDVAISDGTASSEISQSLPAVLGNKAYRITFDINSFSSGTGYQVKLGSNTPYSISYNTVGTKSLCQRVTAGGSLNIYFLSEGLAEGSITNVSVQKLDPNGYWLIGEGWCIGVDKAESDGTVNDSNVNQQGALTSPIGKTYKAIYTISDYLSGSLSANIGGVDYGEARVANGDYTDNITITAAPVNIIAFTGLDESFDGSVTGISVKQVGSYSDQSIYVTAADVQTIAQASVYYLVELTSMTSKNSIYFLPSSVEANNGRYTKLNFTVVSKDALPQPTVGIISFYDSVGGLDTYPMGFYEFRIYEQTSSTNIDPLLATGLLEKGFAFVRDFSGNMQELPDGFNEYDPTLTQYVYSK